MQPLRAMKLKRSLLLPVTASFGAHALLLFGFASPERMLPDVPVRSDTPLEPRELVVIEEEIELVSEDSSEERRDEPASSVPGLPEPPGLPPASIDIEMAVPPRPRVTYEGEPIDRIPSAWTSSGDKVGTGGPPVIAAHLLDNPPRAKYRAAPAYPIEARRTGLSGEVVVEFIVNERGEVVSPRVVRSSGSIFDEPTLRAVSRWKFEPGRKDGRPVRFRMSVPVLFNVHN